jgi:hypothetical protein
MALFFSRAVLGRICMLCLPVFAGCQLMHPASGSISCFSQLRSLEAPIFTDPLQ